MTMRLCAVIAMIGLGGCRPVAPPAPTPPAVAGSAKAVAAAKSPAVKNIALERYHSELPAIAPQGQPAAAQVAAFTWREKLTAAEIPNQPLSGSLDGQPFVCRYASVTPDTEEKEATTWLRFSSLPRGAQCSFRLDDDNVNLEWHLPRGVGEWSKALSDPIPTGTAAFFSRALPNGGIVNGSSYNWAAYVKIEEERGPTQAGGIGSLRGRLALVFEDAKRSWVAGTFVADGCRCQP